METKNIFESLGKRLDRAVLLGVTGPMRTGKSTFVKRFMEQLVIPNIEDPYMAQRARDELPQSGSGRTIMTTEPKFVPEEAVEICPDHVARISVRLIDSVGYGVPGVQGAEEDGKPRMVTTPWFDHEIPMTQAAEVGTKKVMEDHATIGIVVTTDGSVTDLDGEAYREAEARAIRDMQATGKPFVVIVNSVEPQGDAAQALCASLRQEFGATAMALNCQRMELDEICRVLTALLYEFPVTEMRFYMPAWLCAMEDEHPWKTTLYDAMRKSAEEMERLCQAETAMKSLMQTELISGCRVLEADPATGTVSCVLEFPEEAFYRILSEKSGFPVENDGELMTLLTSLSSVKKAYDQVSDALEQARVTGYGIVMPSAGEVKLELPQIVKKGGSYAIKLRASAPSIHMIRTDIQTEISPVVGDEKQSRELADYLLAEYEDNTARLWESNFFGKSLYDLVSEGLGSKVTGVPEESRFKFRDALTRIVNEGSRGLICLIL